MLSIIRDQFRKSTLLAFMNLEVEPALKNNACFIYASGYNGPSINKAQVLWWQTKLPELCRMIYYINPEHLIKGDKAPVSYVLFYINPAALWHEWKRHLKTQMANNDPLADINADVTRTISAALTHRYRLQLED